MMVGRRSVIDCTREKIEGMDNSISTKIVGWVR